MSSNEEEATIALLNLKLELNSLEGLLECIKILREAFERLQAENDLYLANWAANLDSPGPM